LDLHHQELLIRPVEVLCAPQENKIGELTEILDDTQDEKVLTNVTQIIISLRIPSCREIDGERGEDRLREEVCGDGQNGWA
jgi:hypothetical protein